MYTNDYMITQNITCPGIPDGFGERLKEERKRLNLSQVEMAERGGCQRLAQLQYENESRAPTIRYLNSIALAGVDLGYLVLGVRFNQVSLSDEQEQVIEAKVFEWIEKCANTMGDGRLAPDTYKMLFYLFKSFLTQMHAGDLQADFDPTSLLKNAIKVIAG